MPDGDLVLIDGGGELYDYSSDITRTVPVNGTFSPSQKAVYDAVLTVNQAIIDQCRPSTGLSLSDLHALSLEYFTEHLKVLGILSKTVEGNSAHHIVQKYFPHAIGHFLGMDVHDTPDLSLSTKLAEGMIITVEPGLYFPLHDTTIPSRQ
ncbi:xaa-Pro aminopeptidase 3-like [Zophobas morio]|uniref:xaa-Pro aminopeptidase 3-like n=1 Tax=Zophobas morio TaxID=2755281 RepID=UPI0030834591